jgi:hypothetical protein
MIDRAAFTSAMAALATALPASRPITEATYEVYWRACGELSDAEFQRGAEACLRRCRFFPVPAELLEAGRPAVDPAAEAGRALQRAVRLSEYSPVIGTWYSAERIRHELGEAAYQAFHACGGSSALRQLDDEFHGARVRKDFVECFIRIARRDRRLALPEPREPDLTPEPVRALIAGIAGGPA